MNINDNVESQINAGQDFPTIYIINDWNWRLVLSPALTTKKYNWKCKACEVKIYDDVQITTSERHRPSYHVACWRVLYERTLEGITRHNENILRQIEGVELTPCQNARDVPNEL